MLLCSQRGGVKALLPTLGADAADAPLCWASVSEQGLRGDLLSIAWQKAPSRVHLPSLLSAGADLADRDSDTGPGPGTSPERSPECLQCRMPSLLAPPGGVHTRQWSKRFQ